MTKAPQNLDAEKGLLGSILLSPGRVLDDCFQERIGSTHFHHPAHARIFTTLREMKEAGTPIDQITLTSELEGRRILADVGGAPAITDLYMFVPSAGNAAYYRQMLKEKWVLREAVRICRETEQSCEDGDIKKVSDIVQEGLIKINGMMESKADTHDMGDLIVRALDRVELATNGGQLPGIMSGIKPLDDVTRGFQAGQMIVIAAPTKGGKSALALNIAMHNVLKGVPVALFSLEMNADELTDRLLSSHSEVDMGKLGKGRLGADEVDRLVKAGSRLSGTPLFIRDEAVMSPLQFRAAARKMHAQHHCQLMLVDYIQLMEPQGKEENRERQVAQFSRTIKTTASELGIPIIVLAQLNMDGRSRESRAIEQDCNLFLVIQEDDMGDMIINIKYARSCPRERIPVTFRRDVLKFEAQ